MKSQLKNKSRLYAALLMLTLWMLNIPHSFAQEFQKKKEHAENAEMRAYMKDNILPVIASQRKKLDVYLSESEKKQVVEIRKDMKALRMEMREQRKSIDRESGPTDGQKDWLREKRKEQRQLMNQAWEIADRHDDQIAALTEEIEQDAEKWKKEMKTMRQQKAERSDEKNEFRRKGKRRAGRRGHKMHGMKRDFTQPVRFLLFDPEKTEEEKNEGQGFLEMYPNPSSDVLYVEFDQQKSGEVQCTLLNDKGQVIKMYKQGVLTTGNHQLEIDISSLPSGVYFCELVSSSGTSKKRFVKK